MNKKSAGLLVFITFTIHHCHSAVLECPSKDFMCDCNKIEHWKTTALQIKCTRLTEGRVPDLSLLKGRPIQSLSLNGIEITNIHSDVFSGLVFQNVNGGPGEMNLSANPIAGLSIHAFRDMISPGGLEIALNGNGLTKVPFQVLMQVQNLTSLSLKNNNIKRIRPGSFAKIPKLTKLILRGNHGLRIKGGLLQGLENNLETLDLSDIGLTAVPVQAVKTMKSLQFLLLEDNNIKSIPDMLFQGFQHEAMMLNMYLSNNGLHTISQGAFTKPTEGNKDINLHILDLANNQLNNLSFAYDPCSTVFMPVWASILVQNNPINCDCEFYSLVCTAFFTTVTGTCKGPGDMAGLEYDIAGTVNGALVAPGEVMFKAGYGKRAQAKCGSPDLTTWDLTCVKDSAWAKPKDSSAAKVYLCSHSVTLMTITFISPIFSYYNLYM